MQRSMRRRTELASALSEPVGGRQETPATPQAGHFDGAFPSPVTSDEALAIGYSGAWPGAAAEQVAADTRGYEVVRRVVQDVAIDVIGDDRITAAPALHPSEWSLAPVTPLRPWSDLVVKHQSMHLDRAVTRSERMVGTSNVAVPTHRYSVTAEGGA